MTGIRNHNTEEMPKVILRADGSIDVYGWVDIEDERPDVGPLSRQALCPENQMPILRHATG